MQGNWSELIFSNNQKVVLQLLYKYIKYTGILSPENTRAYVHNTSALIVLPNYFLQCYK
jgi:hypothetical protein